MYSIQIQQCFSGNELRLKQKINIEKPSVSGKTVFHFLLDLLCHN